MTRRPHASGRPTAAGGLSDPWPPLPFDAWQATGETLHRWVQIVGKIRLARSPWLNHSWHATLVPGVRGLATPPIPFGTRSLSLGFDFVDHRLRIDASDGRTAGFALAPRSVASFYRELTAQLAALGFEVAIDTRPNELDDALPFELDEIHASYDADAVRRFWHAIVAAERVLQRFRARFVGKCSPVHFFWGSFDLAVTRFSGRPAPAHPGGVPNLPDWVAREAYSQEVTSCGFWPGNARFPQPLFYAYAYPEPPGFAAANVLPAAAAWQPELREFVLPYEAVRTSALPDRTLLEFLESAHAAAADLAGWNRAALEWRGPPERPELDV